MKRTDENEFVGSDFVYCRLVEKINICKQVPYRVTWLKKIRPVKNGVCKKLK
jgi:hypothetical protein